MPDISWSSESDWDDSKDETGINHSNDPYTDSSPGKLKQGYEKQWPPLTHGLVGWWPLHTDKPIDLSGNNNHGTMNGGPTTGVAGRGGLQATSFDGADDEVGVADSNSLDQPDSFSISAWVYATGGSGSFRTIAGKGGSYKFYIYDDDKFRLINNSGGGTVVQGANQVSLNRWYHAVVTYDGSTARLFIDGVEDDSSAYSTSFDTTTADFHIGSDPDGGGQYFNGTIFGVRLYNRALSSAEIQTLYEWGSADLASPPTDGVARYPLDGDATDSFGSNDGTENGSLTYSSDAIRGQSADFDGVDDQINTSTNLFDGSSHTMSLWVKPRDVSNNQQLILDQDNSSGDKRANISIANSTAGNIEYHFYIDGTSYSGSTYIPKGEWSHFVAVFDSSAGRTDIYLNGAPAPNEGGGANAEGVYPDLIVGAARESGKNNYDGHLDDVRIYDYALTPQEVFELYRYGTRGINMNKHTVMQ